MRVSIDDNQPVVTYESTTDAGLVVTCPDCNTNNLIEETLHIGAWTINDEDKPQWCIGCGNELFIPFFVDWKCNQ